MTAWASVFEDNLDLPVCLDHIDNTKSLSQHKTDMGSNGVLSGLPAFTDKGPGEVGPGWDSSKFDVTVPSPVHSASGNVSMLDSAVFRTMFGSDKMRAIMSDQAYVRRLVQVEVALAKVEGDLGIIPAEAAACIAKYSDASKIDMERMRHEVSTLILRRNRCLGE